MNFYAVSGLLNFVTSAAVGLYVFTRDKRDLRYRTYGGFCLSLAIWSLGYFFWQIAGSPEEALFWVRVLMAGAIFIPVTNFHHVTEILAHAPFEKRWIKAGYLFCFGALFLDIFTSVFVEGVSEKLGFPYWPEPGPAFHLYIGLFAYCLVRWTYLLIKESRNASGLRRNQLRYLVIALTIGYAGGITNFLLWYDIPIPPYGNGLVSAYVVLFSYSVVKFQLLDINVVVKKSVIYVLLLLLLVIPCYLLMLLAQWSSFGSINYSFSVISLALFIMVGFLFPKLRFRTEEALERAFFKRRIDYRETLLHSSREMVSIVDIKALADNLVRLISKSLEIRKVSLLLSDENGNYRLEASIGSDLVNPGRVYLSKNGPLPTLLCKRQEAIVKEELEWVPVGPETPQTIETMNMLGADISLPIISKRKLVGILNLGGKEDKALYSNEDLELLSTLANQAAIALENARLYENLKQSQDTLRRADRLSSLGMLTAALAHEIRNPLVAIRTFTQLLPERYEDADFRESFRGLALKEVDRICGLMNDLLGFARPSKPNVAPENVNDVVETVVRILEGQAKEKGMVILREFDDNPPKVWIDSEQMKQVFMNIILNAIQAMSEGGSISIATRALQRNGTEPSGEFVQVEIRDTGLGIPEEHLQHIFDPFFTSKDEGSGLGLAVSHQIVQEHGGFVTVESTLGKGTAFFVHLPVGKPIRPAPNLPAHVNEANLSH
jgi:two-component system nitrogen regulation sensor histidine kinase GlnL